MDQLFYINKTINELSPDSIIIVRKGKIIYANSQLITVSGYERSELIGADFMNFVSPESKEFVANIVKKRKTGNTAPSRYEAKAHLKNGEKLDVEVSLSQVIFQDAPAYQVILRDISKQRNAERKYQNIVDLAPVGFYQTSRTGDFLIVNNELATMLGFKDTNDIINKNIADFYYNESEREKLIKRYDKKSKYEVKNIEVKFKKKDGSPLWVLMTARAIKDNNGLTTSYDGFLTNISERKNKEFELLNRMQLEKLFNDISYQFVRGHYTETDKLIQNALQKLGEFTQVDRVYLFQYSTDGQLMSNTHEWCNKDIEAYINELQDLPISMFPWWTNKMKNNEVIRFFNIEELPQEASAEKEILESQGINSLLVLPVLSGKKLIGFVGFDSVKDKKQWLDQDITMLESIADLFSNEISKTKYINEINQAKTAALEGEKKYKSIFNDNNSVMLIIDPSSGEIKDANKAACLFYGYNYQNIIKLTVDDIYISSSKKTPQEKYKECYKNNKQCTCQHRLANGRIKDVEIFTGKVNIDGKSLIYAIIHDVSERKVAEENVLKLSTSIEQSPISILITDTKGTIEYANPYYSEITGYSLDELLGNNPNIIKSDVQDQAFYTELWDTILSGKRWEGEVCNKKKNGELYWEHAIITPIKNELGHITNFAGIKEDITERKRMIEELISSKEKAEESDRLKSAFLANMSHEIRTPMNGILGFTDLLSRPNLSIETKEKYIQIIHQSGERMLNTVTDIVEISKIEAGLVDIKKSSINIISTIATIVEGFEVEAQKKGLEIKLLTPHSSQSLNCLTDKNKFESILNKLIKNAIKYSQKGTIRIAYHVKENLISTTVSDEGIGIPNNRLEAIFNRFEQADIEDSQVYQGSGLGLAICKSYVQMLGGDIYVKSELNVGSKFTFNIPFEV